MGHLKDIVIPIGIGLLTFAGLLFTPGSFLIHPSFDIFVTEPVAITNHINVTNVGLVQAKNVRINVDATGPITLVNNLCPEGFDIIPTEQIDQILIQLNRMSSNLECTFIISKSSFDKIVEVVVTADSSPAYIWNYEENQLKKLDLEISAVFAGIISIIAGVITSFVTYEYHKKARERKSIQKIIDRELMQIKLDKAIYHEGEDIKGFVLINSTVDANSWNPIKIEVADPNGLVVYSAAIPRISATSSQISISTGDPNWQIFGMYTIYLMANDGTGSQAQFIYEKKT